MKTLNIPIAAALKAQLDAYSKANGIHKKKVVELALEGYLKKAAPTVATGAAVASPVDDQPAWFDDHPALVQHRAG